MASKPVTGGHYNPNTGKGGPCHAAPGNCPLLQGEHADEVQHFATPAEAEKYAEEKNAEKYGLVAPINYSFQKQFKQQEEAFDAEFETFPKSFFKADLRGKHLGKDMPLDNLTYLLENTDLLSKEERFLVSQAIPYFNRSGMALQMAQKASVPADNQMPNEEVVRLAAEMGITDLEPAEAKYYGSKRLWRGMLNGKQVALVDVKKGEEMGVYSFRFAPPPFETGKNFRPITLRTLAGAARVQKVTGDNILAPAVADVKKIEGERTAEKQFQQKVDAVLPLVRSLQKLEDRQWDGRNHLAQRARIKEAQSSSARVWEDKKQQGKEQMAMAAASPLKTMFRKIELDADVDPESWREFERDLEETRAKLPPIPADRQPELRVRYLGRHKAEGLFVPHRNALVLDVRTSSAMVHEYSHALDLVAHGNASLRPEFRDVVRAYSKAIEQDPRIPENKQDYFASGTEVFARYMEVYAHERLGIQNSRLLDPSRFNTQPDYEPIMNNQEMKEKAFAFFDSLYEKK